MDVGKGSRSASASVIFNVVEGAPPDVWVDLAFFKVKATDRVQLLGFYKTSVQPVKVEWTSSQEEGEFIVFLSSKLQGVCPTTFVGRVSKSQD